MTNSKFNGRGTFFFSNKQARNSTIGRNKLTTIVKLDSGIITEYTEMISEENSDGSYELPKYDVKIRPFLERFPDGVILGNGAIYSVNGIVQTYEQDKTNNKD
jgi:repressor of nif and glnA expression